MSEHGIHWQWIRPDVFHIFVEGRWIAQGLERRFKQLNVDLSDVEHPYIVILEVRNGIFSIIRNLICSARAGNMSEEEHKGLYSYSPPVKDPERIIFVFPFPLSRLFLKIVLKIQGGESASFDVVKSPEKALKLIDASD